MSNPAGRDAVPFADCTTSAAGFSFGVAITP